VLKVVFLFLWWARSRVPTVDSEDLEHNI